MTLPQNSIDGLGYEKASSTEERNILDITADNLARCTKTYRNAYDQVAKYFYVALQHKPPQDIESIQHDLRNKLYYTSSLLENARTTEVLKVYNQYYPRTSAFPTDEDLVFIPEGLMPALVQTERKISPKDLYGHFRTTDAYGLVGVQFLAAFHVFMGGESYLSRNAMSELFHNISM